MNEIGRKDQIILDYNHISWNRRNLLMIINDNRKFLRKKNQSEWCWGSRSNHMTKDNRKLSKKDRNSKILVALLRPLKNENYWDQKEERWKL